MFAFGQRLDGIAVESPARDEVRGRMYTRVEQCRRGNGSEARLSVAARIPRSSVAQKLKSKPAVKPWKVTESSMLSKEPARIPRINSEVVTTLYHDPT